MTSNYAFDAKTWSQCILRTVHLTHVFRQKDDGELPSRVRYDYNSYCVVAFVELLSAMRLGNLTRNHIDILKCLSRPVVYDDGIEPSEMSVPKYCNA